MRFLQVLQQESGVGVDFEPNASGHPRISWVALLHSMLGVVLVVRDQASDGAHVTVASAVHAFACIICRSAALGSQVVCRDNPPHAFMPVPQ